MKLITLTSDFGVQSQGVGNMEAVIYSICPDARVVHLMHGIPDFSIIIGARTMETIQFMPIGFHVCVVDPGVGTERKPIIIQTTRGDYLIGPDNGVLVPIAQILGIKKVVEITNQKYMIIPVHPIFHGRHIFSPVAAHLACGVPMEKFGREISPGSLTAAPYPEATVKEKRIEAVVIHVNKYGSLHLNITHQEFDKLGLTLGQKITVELPGKKLTIPFTNTFGEVPEQKELILKDEYGRVELAINQGHFSERYNIKIGEKIIIRP